MRDPRSPLRVRGDVLRRTAGQRPVGIASRHQPRGWPGALPGGTPCGPQAGGEPRGTLRAPCAVLDTEQHPIPCALRAREPDDVADAQARGRGGHQEDPVPRMRCVRAQALECLEAQDPWELRSPRPWWEIEVEDIPAQGLRRDELQPCGRLRAGTPRQAPLDQEVVQVRAHRRWTEAVRGALGARRQAGHRGDRGLLGLGGPPLHLHVVAHLGTSWCPRSSLACKGKQTSAPPAGAMTELRYAIGRNGHTRVQGQMSLRNPSRESHHGRRVRRKR